MTSQLIFPPSVQRAPAEPRVSNLAHLVFLVDSQSYACPAKDVVHLRLLADAPLLPNQPGAPAWEVGRLKTQDLEAGIPIISIRRVWGLPAQPDVSLTGRQSLLVVSLGGEPCALLVDTCQCVLPALPRTASSLHLPAALTGTMGSAFRTVVRWKETLLVVIDINQLLSGRPTPRPALELSSPKFS